MITAVALQLCILLAQIVTVALLAPFLTDLECIVENTMAGRPGPWPGRRWRQLRAGWRQNTAISSLSWMGLCATTLAGLSIPFASTQIPLHFLSEPLACGVLLIVASISVCIQALAHSPTRLLRLRLTSSLGALGHDLLFLIPLLALTGTLITVGLPGSATLVALLQQRLLQPSPALLGGLVFIAGAILLILNRRLLSDSWHERLISATEGRHRSLLRYQHDLSALCWYLLMADLIWPDSIATAAATPGHLLLLWCLAAPAKLGFLVVFATAWRVIRPLPSAMLALVLTGAAILLVVAGRLAS